MSDLEKRKTVYPACAGIDPRQTHPQEERKGLPRMRGDRPWRGGEMRGRPSFTPHARGSTLVEIAFFICKVVYPACAGIDL